MRRAFPRFALGRATLLLRMQRKSSWRWMTSSVRREYSLASSASGAAKHKYARAKRGIIGTVDPQAVELALARDHQRQTDFSLPAWNGVRRRADQTARDQRARSR